MFDDTRTPLQRALERIELCREVVKEVHHDLEIPQDPEHKADLYLSIDELAREVVHLLTTVNDHVWGQPIPPEDE
jgi:hypothetical protein